jgi:methylmalonyl-CoA mutase N-terminal domain/subunit
LRRVKEKRSNADARRTLDAVKRAAFDKVNLMSSLIDAARARVTVGETVKALADEYGRYQTSGTW